MRTVRFGRLSIVTVITALLISLPILVIMGFVFSGSFDLWSHLVNTVLVDYVINSALLMLGVGSGVLLLGVGSAWLTTQCEFPFRRLFSLLLLMPMAMPAYIIAYAYTGLLDFAGPVQSAIRDFTGLRYGQYWFPEIRSLGGAAVMLSLVLYPYVYLMARAAFLSQSVHTLDVARSLGVPRWRAFFKVSLPMARPAIIAGLSLALMETLADYGTVQYFGVSTFTTGIFRTYYGFGDAGGAAQLAVLLLTFVLVLVVMEKYSRRRIGYFEQTNHPASSTRIPMLGIWRWFALLACFIPVFLGFILPVWLLLGWSLGSDQWRSVEFFELAWNSFSLAGLAAFVSVGFALILAYAARLQPHKLTLSAVQIASLGYALPGTIIAIGVLITFAWLDFNLLPIVEKWTDRELGLLFSGTLFALVFAYTVRFLAVSLGSVQSGLKAIKPSLDSSARLLGRTPFQVLKEIHIPLLNASVLTAFLIVFVDVLKELPATLILRPFNFNTLAVRAYELASDERLYDAAPASLMIVLVGLVPVFLLNRWIAKR